MLLPSLDRVHLQVLREARKGLEQSPADQTGFVAKEVRVQVMEPEAVRAQFPENPSWDLSRPYSLFVAAAVAARCWLVELTMEWVGDFEV